MGAAEGVRGAGDRAALALALGLGLGRLPRAPGTWGSLGAFPLAWLLAGSPWPAWAAAVAGLSALGVWACGRAARLLGVHDHPAIVWDEVVGCLLALAWVPPGLSWALAAFALFRLLDVLKPGPLGWLDRRLGGGWGIMADDLGAGLGAGLLLAGAGALLAG